MATQMSANARTRTRTRAATGKASMYSPVYTDPHVAATPNGTCAAHKTNTPQSTSTINNGNANADARILPDSSKFESTHFDTVVFERIRCVAPFKREAAE